MDGITHALTIGRRPELLAETLGSLSDAARALPTFAVNDFGDTESDAVLRAAIPHAQLVPLGGHVGHHAAVDAMYARIETPFVWHGEDDWVYACDWLVRARDLLEADPRISVVCARALDDFPAHTVPAAAAVPRAEAGGVRYARLDGLHPEWFGFTFNPHLARLDLWRGLGGYARFAKERHISRALRAQGRFVAYLDPGACRHIGENAGVTAPAPKRFAALRNWWRGR